ncbi:CHAD domain-containing protein [Microbulbifer pacificus]|uniref:CHAD domain-containing protein n=1 Tax=Microbulbifer pacificus TaxID=407164 RepID=UPI00131A2C7B|nr:CHAD domain-containing protein [Microbulbifer pacificus]
MSYRFHPQEPPGREMQRIGGEQISAALRTCTQPDKEGATHQIRKHCKKMRALARLLQKTDDRTEKYYRFENAHYRRIAELLSASRDAVSLHDALVRQLGGERFPETAALLQSRIDTGDTQDALQQARELLQQGAEHIGNHAFGGLDRKDLKRGYARSYRRTFKAAQKALDKYDDTAIHTLRKRVKDQWYHTRLLQTLQPKKIGRRRARLKILASALGDWRDLRLLCAYLATHKATLDAKTEKELIPLLDSARQRLEALRTVIERECRCLFEHKRWKSQRKCKLPTAE